MQLDFVVPGFSKCGTTTLCSLLNEHPQIVVARNKEPNFFSLRYDRDWTWYSDLFRGAAEGCRLGEGSTTYSSGKFAQIACDRMLAHFPSLKFIFIARNPITRIESSFREMHHSGHRYGVAADYSLGPTLRRLPNMIADTRYWKLINVYRRRVPDDRILVLFLEDFQRDPAAGLARCFEFLGVDPTVQIPHLSRRLNTASEKYYDTPLYRRIVARRWTRWLFETLCGKNPNRWPRRLGLRRPFRGPVQWEAETWEWFVRQIGDEARAFLRFYQKPDDFWDLRDCRVIPRRQAA